MPWNSFYISKRSRCGLRLRVYIFERDMAWLVEEVEAEAMSGGRNECVSIPFRKLFQKSRKSCDSCYGMRYLVVVQLVE